jgi:hypothetical protein
MCASSYHFNSIGVRMKSQHQSLVQIKAVLLVGVVLLSACAQNASAPESAAQRYRCEAGVEFAARFSGDAVSIDSTRGYELLFRDAKPLPDPAKPNEYRNQRMSAEFNTGANGQEALLRYPLLPLVLRCIRQE